MGGGGGGGGGGIANKIFRWRKYSEPTKATLSKSRGGAFLSAIRHCILKCVHSELEPFSIWSANPHLYKLYAVPVRICSTREDMHYPWGYALPVSHILSTRDDMHYPWVISSVPVSHILSTGEDMQYPRGKFHSFFIHINLLTGTAYLHGYWWYDSLVLMIWLTGTAYPHKYWGYDSRVLMIWLTGNAYPQGYCI